MSNKYALDILNCPPDISKVKSVVYSSPTKLAVTEGADELMSMDLKNFFVEVTDAQKTSFTLPAHSNVILPYDLYKFDYCGMSTTGEAKFASFLINYENATQNKDMYIDWAFHNEVFEGPLSIKGSNDFISNGFNPRFVNNISAIKGSFVGYAAINALLISTNGGLKIWSPLDETRLICTINFPILSDVINAAKSDSYGHIWAATDKGLSKITYTNSTFAIENFSTLNSEIPSDRINDISISANKIALATDSGIAIFDFVEKTWKRYSKLNVNQIKTDIFTKIIYNDLYIIAATEEGVYTFSNNVWTLYDSTTQGWDGISNECTAIELYDGEVFVGTTDNFLTFSIGATTVTSIPNMQSFQSISSINYYHGTTGTDKVLVSYAEGGISRYDLTSTSWDWNYTGSIGYTGSTGPIINSGVYHMTKPVYFAQGDSPTPIWDGQIFYGNSIGYASFDPTTFICTKKPDENENGNIMVSFPLNNSVEIGLTQSIVTAFSKPLDDSINTHFTIIGATGLTFNSYYGGELFEIKGATYSRDTKCIYSISEGLTASDGTYFKDILKNDFFTENTTPINGWHKMGKQLTLTGSDENLLQPIVFRNPHSFPVTITALVAL